MSTILARLSAALSDRYRVDRELGAGGMATVYLARDLKHDRDVAIKLLKPELTQSLTGERFLREIAITARLNHPHILALLDMLSGRYDSVFPYESSQVPFLRLLGSPPGTKKQGLFEGGHFLPRPMWVSESTRWLDQQFGLVNRQ
ncbi:MAG: protein kinase [Gemmatimonadaceae bacterium]|nr:protein kinase [Gemmatimonadaceae bacterium]